MVVVVVVVVRGSGVVVVVAVVVVVMVVVVVAAAAVVVGVVFIAVMLSIVSLHSVRSWPVVAMVRACRPIQASAHTSGWFGRRRVEFS